MDDRDHQRPHQVDCGCYSPSHHETFETFQKQINDSLKNLKPQRTTYDRVLALIVYWQHGDPDMSTSAGELGALLQKGYGFEVESHVIKNGDGRDNATLYQKFNLTLANTINSISEKDKNNLLIVYYAGHAVQRYENNTLLRKVWTPRPNSETQLDWDDLQHPLRRAYCDILFLFECCLATSMIVENKSYLRRCELLCASGALDGVSEKRNASFTKTIITEWSDPRYSKGFDVSHFHSIMSGSKVMHENNLSATPGFRRYSSSSHRTGIFLKDRRALVRDSTVTRCAGEGADPDASRFKDLCSLSDARILVKLRLADPTEQLLHGGWREWILQRPNNVTGMELAVVESIRCHGLFDSDSSLLLFSMPVWVWNNLEADAACEPIGIVRSDNLLKSIH